MKSAFLAGLLIIGITLLGWLSSPREWEKATGWNKIPQSLKPSFYQPEDYDPEIFWLGHAGFFIRWEKQNILIDPNLSDHTTIVKRHLANAIAASELPPIDAVLITHAHFDHLDNPTLASIPSIKAIVLPTGSENYLELTKHPETKILTISVNAVVTIGDIKITAVKAAHGGNRFHPFSGRHFAVGYILETDKRSLYISGDTAMGEHFGEIKQRFHPDTAILPIGGYSPRIPLKYHHLNPQDAINAAKLMGIKKVIPAHFGTFRVAFDRPDTALPLFARLAYDDNVLWEMPILLTKNSF